MATSGTVERRAPVVWAAPLWAMVEGLKDEAAAFRRVRPDHPDASLVDVFSKRLEDALKEAEGEVWVTTSGAVELTGKKADTVRSWHRRGRVRSRKNGGTILYHRDDLVALGAA